MTDFPPSPRDARLARWIARRRAELREARARVAALERAIEGVERGTLADADQAERAFAVLRSIAATTPLPLLGELHEPRAVLA